MANELSKPNQSAISSLLCLKWSKIGQICMKGGPLFSSHPVVIVRSYRVSHLFVCYFNGRREEYVSLGLGFSSHPDTKQTSLPPLGSRGGIAWKK